MATIVLSLQIVLISLLVYAGISDEIGELPANFRFLLLACVGTAFVLLLTAVLILRQTYLNRITARDRELDFLRFKHIEEQNRIHRRQRHDLYNHLTVISGLAQLGNLDRLLQYLEIYSTELNRGIANISSGLREIDILIYNKFASAQAESIEISYFCKEPLRCESTKIVRLINVLANALDNAIQAAANADEKRVSLLIEGNATHYIINVTNTYDPAINLDGILKTKGSTTKPKGKGGQGLAILAATVKSLGGRSAYSIGSGVCRLRIELPKAALGGFS